MQISRHRHPRYGAAQAPSRHFLRPLQWTNTGIGTDHHAHSQLPRAAHVPGLASARGRFQRRAAGSQSRVRPGASDLAFCTRPLAQAVLQVHLPRFRARQLSRSIVPCQRLHQHKDDGDGGARCNPSASVPWVQSAIWSLSVSVNPHLACVQVI